MDPRKLPYPPSADEVRAIGARIGSGSQIAEFLRLGSQGGRTWRRWTSGESQISFGNWYTLCALAEALQAQRSNPTP